MKTTGALFAGALVAGALVAQAPDDARGAHTPDDARGVGLVVPPEPAPPPAPTDDPVVARRNLLYEFNRMSARAKLEYHEHLALTAHRLVSEEYLDRNPLTYPAQLKFVYSELEQFLMAADDSDIVVIHNNLGVYMSIFRPKVPAQAGSR